LGGPKEACVREGAHWHNLVNMIEPSMCGGDATVLSNDFDRLLDIKHTWPVVVQSSSTRK